MRRGPHLAISLIAVVLLTRPFDCLAAGGPSRQAEGCCLKGNCGPTAKSDECCKRSVPDGNQFVISKAADHSQALVAFISAHIPNLISPSTFHGLADPVKHPPPRVGLTAASLPLLI